MAKNALILCTGNSCRSQMAEALWRELGDGEWACESAGSNPAGYVHPLAIEVMAESGCDISQNKSKHLDSFVSRSWDIVVTVCGSAQEACPVFAGAANVEHWPFEDPADAEGTEDQKREFFREIRDQIKDRIQQYLDPASSG